MSETAENTEAQTEKAHDYDPIYAVDANSGLAPQPGGAAKAADANIDLLVDEEGELKPVEGDVHSEAHQAKIDAAAEGKTKEQADADAAKTAGASDEAIKAQESGDATGDQGQAAGDSTEAKSAYDPSDKSVADVKAYVEEHPEEKDAVLAAEAGGKNRPTIASL